MRRKVVESSVLFVSIVKWLFLATCAGILVGLSTTIFLKALAWSSSATAAYPYYYFLLPVALFMSAAIVQYLAPDAEGHGTEKIIEAIHKRSGKIDPRVVPVKLIATVMTIAFGGSAGKEGPAAQIGAAVTSSIASLLRFDDRDRKKLVICGISAGFATVFGTPIAGAIFGVEVLFVGGMLYDVLLPSFVAGIVGFQVSSSLGIAYFHEPLRFIPQFSSLFFLKVCSAGIFFGLCSLLLIEGLKLFERIGHRMPLWPPLKGLAAGSVLALGAFFLSTRYLGLGLKTIQEAIEGTTLPSGAFLLKILFTAITLGFGGSGGIITPIFFVGAAAGNVFASILGFDVSVFSAIGMIALLAGSANTPISASIMAIEIFGPAIGPYAAVACIISFLMTGHRSVYPSQVLSFVKSSSLAVAQGREMRDLGSVEYQPRPKSLSDIMTRGIKSISKKKKP
jgi:H+/Cl- antiporter ClcA